MAEALRAYTSDAAFALRLDDAGVLRPGKLGDVAIVDRDPFEVDWASVMPKVVTTIAGGRVVYDCRA